MPSIELDNPPKPAENPPNDAIPRKPLPTRESTCRGWIPAYAGMTEGVRGMAEGVRHGVDREAGMTEVGAGMTEGVRHGVDREAGMV